MSSLTLLFFELLYIHYDKEKKFHIKKIINRILIGGIITKQICIGYKFFILAIVKNLKKKNFNFS